MAPFSNKTFFVYVGAHKPSNTNLTEFAKHGLEGGPDPAFPLLFHKNPASLTFSLLSRIPFFLSRKYIKND